MASAPVALAQTTSTVLARPFVHEEWRLRDGLPIDATTDVTQTADGYIWVSTYDGLARFDGVRFQLFTVADGTHLPSNRLIRLEATSDGALWILTEDGRVVLYRNGRFRELGMRDGLTSRVRDFIAPVDGRLWLAADEGLYRSDHDRVVRVDPARLAGPVTALSEGRDSSLVVGFASGRAFRVHVADRHRLTELPPVVRVTHGTALAFLEDTQGRLWMATDQRPLWRLEGDRWRAVARPAGFSYLLAELNNGRIWAQGSDHSLVLDSNGTVLTKGLTGAVFRRKLTVRDEQGMLYRAEHGTLLREDQIIAQFSVGAKAQRTAKVYGMIRDREGSIWVATNGDGLHRFKPPLFDIIGRSGGLASGSVHAVMEDHAGSIWIGTRESSLFRWWDNHLDSIVTTPHPSPVALTMHQGRDDTLWIGVTDLAPPVLACPMPTGRTRRLPCTAPGSTPAREIMARAVFHDAHGSLWVGSSNGLWRRRGGTWERLDTLPDAPKAVVQAMLFTPDSALWLATDGEGVFRVVSGSDDQLTFRQIDTRSGLPFDRVRALMVDRDGWLWIGTAGRGLARLQPNEWRNARTSGRIDAISTDKGLHDPGIHAILADDADRLWMSGNRGIAWVRRADLHAVADGRQSRVYAHVYTESDGLANREANGGSQPSAVRTRDGRLWFATQGGVAIVDPGEVRRSSTPAPILVERVVADGTPFDLSGRTAAAIGTRRGTIRIEYTALTYLSPANLRFRYMLEGYDRTWVEAGSLRAAHYTRVPPGDYQFRVQVTFPDGRWSQPGATARIIVAPMLWETKPVRAIGLIAFAVVTWGLFRWRDRRARAQEDALRLEVQGRTQELLVQREQLATQAGDLKALDRAKSAFMAGLSDDFRVPLSAAITELEDARDQQRGSGSVILPKLEGALHNARSVLHLVNQLMDVAQLESGQRSLQAIEADLATFVRSMGEIFSAIAERKGIAFECRVPAAPLIIWFDSDAMEKVLASLLNNALRFTPAGGHVTLVLMQAGNEHDFRRAEIVITDSGPSIPVEELPFVFERFRSTGHRYSRVEPGSSLTLSLTRDLVGLHGGSITVSSPWPEQHTNLASGVRYLLTIPEGGEHLRVEPRVVAAGSDAFDAPVPSLLPQAPVRSVEASNTSNPRPNALSESTTECVRPVVLLGISDETLRGQLSGALAHRYELVEATTAADTHALATQLQPDLLLVDALFRDAEGTPLWKSLRQHADLAYLSVIALADAIPSSEMAAVQDEPDGPGMVVSTQMHPQELLGRMESLMLAQCWAGEHAIAISAAMPVLDLGRAEQQHDAAWLRRVESIVTTRFGEPGFGSSALADAMHTDGGTLHRRLRELSGVSAPELLRRVRLERAAALLQDEDLNLAHVAYAVGFRSVHAFATAFGEAYGMTAMEFRAFVVREAAVLR